MSTRLNISARIQWRDGGTSFAQDNVPFYCIAPGQSQIDWQTEKVMAVSQLKDLIDAINQAGGLTFLMDMHYVSRFFPKNRTIDFMSVAFKSRSPGQGSDGTLMISAGKDLKVTVVMPLTDHLVALAKAKGITLDMQVSTTQVVTLVTSQKFSTS
jgi:hypothetical protein